MFSKKLFKPTPRTPLSRTRHLSLRSYRSFQYLCKNRPVQKPKNSRQSLATHFIPSPRNPVQANCKTATKASQGISFPARVTRHRQIARQQPRQLNSFNPSQRTQYNDIQDFPKAAQFIANRISS